VVFKVVENEFEGGRTRNDGRFEGNIEEYLVEDAFQDESRVRDIDVDDLDCGDSCARIGREEERVRWSR